MGIKTISIALLLLFSSQSLAEEPRGVPDKLFGISIGGIYDIGNPDVGDLGNLPIKRFTGTQRFLGHGVHYYFKPKEEQKFFKYVEKQKRPQDKYFETSFRLYLLPVIPPTITTAEQLDKAKLNWEVTLIEWSNDPKKKEDAYYWAIDLCKTFAVDIGVKPEIINEYDSKWYECTFSAGDREFKVSSLSSKSVQLSFKRDVSDKKQEMVDNILRKLQAKEIRPY